MRKTLKIVSSLIAIISIVVIVIINTTDINQYKGKVTDLVEDATGRTLQIRGDLGFALSLVPSLVVEDVTFSNALWASKPEMISLQKFEIKIALLPLLTGDIQINKLILVNPDILLETDKKGMKNWVFSTTKTTDETTNAIDQTASIVVHNIQIENASIRFIDGVSGQKTNFHINEIIMASEGVDEPLSLIIEAAYNELPVSVNGRLGSLKQLMANNESSVDLTVKASGAELSLKGQLSKPMDGQGINLAVTFSIDSLATLSKLVGSELPDFGPVNLSATLTNNKESYLIQSLDLKAGHSDLSGDVTVNFANIRPTITAQLKSNLIDLDQISDNEESNQTTKKGRIFPSNPLGFNKLNSVNVNVFINTKKIKTSSMILADTNIKASLKRGVLSIKPLASVIAGGKLTGSFNLNGQGDSAILSTSINLIGLEPNQLIDLNNKLLGAKTDVMINVTGSGTTISQIMANLNGKLVVKVGQGILKDNITGALGIDLLTKLVDVLNPFSSGNHETKLLCGVVNFDIENGLATTDKGIAISTTQMTIVGSGGINLKTEAIDIGIRPEAKEVIGINVGKLTSLVRVGGTLAKPKPAANILGAVSTGVTVTTAVATGGLSLLASGLLERANADPDPCATALGQKSATKQPEKSTATKAGDAVKNGVGAVTDTLKGLFN